MYVKVIECMVHIDIYCITVGLSRTPRAALKSTTAECPALVTAAPGCIVKAQSHFTTPLQHGCRRCSAGSGGLAGCQRARRQCSIDGTQRRRHTQLIWHLV
jgi:hypothetical protein